MKIKEYIDEGYSPEEVAELLNIPVGQVERIAQITPEGYTEQNGYIKHSCGTIIDIRQGFYCPTGWKGYRARHLPTAVYLVYFPKLRLYKVGISVNVAKRFDIEFELIAKTTFKTGTEALKFEAYLLDKVYYLKHNSNKLKDGNTETFLWNKSRKELFNLLNAKDYLQKHSEHIAKQK